MKALKTLLIVFGLSACAYGGPGGPPGGAPIYNQNFLQPGATFYVSSGTVRNLNTNTLKFADGTSQTTANGGGNPVILEPANATTARQNGSFDVLYASAAFIYSQGTPKFAALQFPGGQCLYADATGNIQGVGGPCGSSNGVISPGSFTWTNTFGVFASTLSVSTITLANSIVDLGSGNRIFGISGAGGSNFFAANNAGGTLAGTGSGNQGVGYFSLTNLTTGAGNTATGPSAVQSATSGSLNTGTGANSLLIVTTGSGNTAYGAESGYNPTTGGGLVTGSSDTFVGFNAGTSNPSIVNGIAIGANSVVTTNNSAVIGGAPGTFNTVTLAVSSITTSNIVLPDGSVFTNNTGLTTGMVAASSITLTSVIIDKSTGHNIFQYIPSKNDLFSGESTGSSPGSGLSNVGYGPFGFTNLTSGGANTAIGSDLLQALTSGSNNTSAGSNALAGVNTGSGNTAVGSDAGWNHNTASGVISGSSNTFVGASAGTTNSSVVNGIAIGAGATVLTNNTAVIGGSSNTASAINLIVTSVTVAGLPSGQCVQTASGGLLSVTGSACGSGGGSSGVTVYPATATASFPFGLSASTVSLTGPGNFSFLNIPDGKTYQVLGSSGAGISPGHIAVGGSSNTLVDGGLPSTGGGGSGSGVVLQNPQFQVPFMALVSSNVVTSSNNMTNNGSTVTFTNVASTVFTNISTFSLTGSYFDVSQSTINVSTFLSNGTAPSLVAGTNVTIGGTWPNQTVNSSGGSVTSVAGVNGITSTGSTAITVSVSSVSLSTQVIGNLPIGNLNSGTGATSSTFWRGDQTWAAPISGGGGASSLAVYNGVTQISSPTISVGADGTSLTAFLVGSSSAAFKANPSSVTLQGNAVNLAALAASTGSLTTSVVNIGLATGTIQTQLTAVAVSTGALAVSTTSLQTQLNGVPSLSSTNTWTGAQTYNSTITFNSGFQWNNVSTSTFTGVFFDVSGSTLNVGQVEASGSDGTAGQVLTSGGNGANVSWTSAGTGNVVLASTQAFTGGNTFQSTSTFNGGILSSSQTIVGSGSNAWPLTVYQNRPAAGGIQILSTTTTISPEISVNNNNVTSAALRCDSTGCSVGGLAGGIPFALMNQNTTRINFNTDNTISVLSPIIMSSATTVLSSSTFNGTIAISSGLLTSGSAGTSGQALTSGGPGTIPTWTTISGGGGGSSTITVQNNGTNFTVGLTTINFVAGTGALLATSSPTVGQVNVTYSADTAVILTKATDQSGSPIYCASSNGTDNYTCTLAAAAALTTYTTGMQIVLSPDVSNVGAATLNIDIVGLKNIKQNDGTTDPVTGMIVSGQTVTLTYDGTVWRLPCGVSIAGCQSIVSGTITGVTAGAGLTGGGTSGAVTVSVSSVSLSSQVIGNLPVTNLNSGTNADSSHFWRGDGQWISSSTFGSGVVGGVVVPSTFTWPGVIASSIQVIGSSSANLLTVSSNSTGALLLAVSSTPAVNQNDFLLSISSTNGTLALGVQNNSHVVSSGTAPSLSSCGTGSPTVVGTDMAGTITLGTGSPTACTLNFSAPYANTPVCLCGVNGVTSCNPTTSSSTSIIFTLGVTETTINYICIGQKG